MKTAPTNTQDVVSKTSLFSTKPSLRQATTKTTCLSGRSPSQDKQKTVCKYGGVETLDEGMKCYCPAGKVPSDSDCVDEDECQRIREGKTSVVQRTF